MTQKTTHRIAFLARQDTLQAHGHGHRFATVISAPLPDCRTTAARGKCATGKLANDKTFRSLSGDTFRVADHTGTIEDNMTRTSQPALSFLNFGC